MFVFCADFLTDLQIALSISNVATYSEYRFTLLSLARRLDSITRLSSGSFPEASCRGDFEQELPFSFNFVQS